MSVMLGSSKEITSFTELQEQSWIHFSALIELNRVFQMCQKLIHVCEKMRILILTEEYGEKFLCAGGKISKLESGYI